MTPRRGAGASAPALPVSTAPDPIFKIGETVWDIHKSQQVEILGVVRYERTEFKCVVMHSGAHTRECKREASYWFQYHVANITHKGRHNAARVDYHASERELSWEPI